MGQDFTGDSCQPVQWLLNELFSDSSELLTPCGSEGCQGHTWKWLGSCRTIPSDVQGITWYQALKPKHYITSQTLQLLCKNVIIKKRKNPERLMAEVIFFKVPMNKQVRWHQQFSKKPGFKNFHIQKKCSFSFL